MATNSTRRGAGVAAVLALAGAAAGQYEQDFDTLAADPNGTDLNGQDEYYLPSVGGTTARVFTHVNNALGVAPHPTGGGTNFVGEQSQPGAIFGRSQRDMFWGTNLATVCFDFYASNDGSEFNNIGSFSGQPHNTPATHRSWIILASYGLTPGVYQLGYNMFDAMSQPDPQPGRFPGPEWQSLELNTWYRSETVIDFNVNKVVAAAITNLATNVRADADLSGDTYFLGGGEINDLQFPTGFRLFSGSETNVVGWDNVCIVLDRGACCDQGCYPDCDSSTGPGVLDIFDFLCFQNRYAAGASYACNCDTTTGQDLCDIFDFLCFQNAYSAGCP